MPLADDEKRKEVQEGYSSWSGLANLKNALGFNKDPMAEAIREKKQKGQDDLAPTVED